uniref:Uncharacterized protein n=1 Tax=Anguilla anguilla TaxID=7936 RepID=A0A0E9XHZ8_ANGAN
MPDLFSVVYLLAICGQGICSMLCIK